MTRRLRPLTTAALTLALALSVGGCDKGDGGTTNPGGGDGAADGGGSKDSGGALYTYKADGFTLTGTMQVKLELSSSEGQGATEIEARSLIEATPEGGQLKVHGQILELTKYLGTGSMDPEFMKKQAEEAGQPVPDMEGDLRSAESWSIISLKGEADDDATKALAENQGEDDGNDFGLFGLPDLPSVDLKEGEKVELPTKDDERQLPFGAIPVQVDETWTLRGIDANGVAELDVTIEGSGATELSGGGGSAMVSTLEESAFTIFFDTKTQLPVSFTGYSASETTVDAQGQSFSFALNTEITASYVEGGSAPAEAAPAEAAPAEAAPAEAAPAEDAAAAPAG